MDPKYGASQRCGFHLIQYAGSHLPWCCILLLHVFVFWDYSQVTDRNTGENIEQYKLKANFGLINPSSCTVELSLRVMLTWSGDKSILGDLWHLWLEKLKSSQHIYSSNFPFLDWPYISHSHKLQQFEGCSKLCLLPASSVKDFQDERKHCSHNLPDLTSMVDIVDAEECKASDFQSPFHLLCNSKSHEESWTWRKFWLCLLPKLINTV